jgi:hypothetical protein
LSGQDDQPGPEIAASAVTAKLGLDDAEIIARGLTLDEAADGRDDQISQFETGDKVGLVAQCHALDAMAYLGGAHEARALDLEIEPRQFDLVIEGGVAALGYLKELGL